MKKIHVTPFILLGLTSYSQVGINTTTPQADLDVNGTAFVRQNLGLTNQLYFNNTPTTSPDVLLKRTNNNTLQTEAIQILKNNASTSSSNFQSFDNTTDAYPSFSINKEGTIVLGNGDELGDVRISRGGANQLRLQNATLAIAKTGTSDNTPAIRLSKNDLNSLSNPYPEFEININGKLRWGNGTDIPDLNLERDPTTSKLKLTGTAYFGSAGQRFLLIDPTTGLISMSTSTTTLRTNEQQTEINELKNRIQKLEKIIQLLEAKISTTK